MVWISSRASWNVRSGPTPQMVTTGRSSGELVSAGSGTAAVTAGNRLFASLSFDAHTEVPLEAVEHGASLRSQLGRSDAPRSGEGGLRYADRSMAKATPFASMPR